MNDGSSSTKTTVLRLRLKAKFTRGAIQEGLHLHSHQNRQSQERFPATAISQVQRSLKLTKRFRPGPVLRAIRAVAHQVSQVFNVNAEKTFSRRDVAVSQKESPPINGAGRRQRYNGSRDRSGA
jgi:hypothetical protein